MQIENSKHCNNAILTKTLMTPVVNTKTITKYKEVNNQLVNTEGRSGYYNVISNEAVFSKTTTLFGLDIQVVGRSCEVSNNISTSTKSTGNMLIEHFIFTFSGNLTLKESCPTETGIVSTKWNFTESASIRLPVTCSLSSPQINCGALIMTSHQTKQVKIKTTRMEIIHHSHTEEAKATLKKEDFISSEEFPITASFKPFQLASWLTLSWKYWAVIAAAGILVIAIILIITCKCYGFTTTSENRTSGTPATNFTTVYNNQATNTVTTTVQPAIEATINTATMVEDNPSGPTPSAPAPETRSRRNRWGSMKKEPKKQAEINIDNPPTYEELEDDGGMTQAQLMELC